ncbi:hypothetical protein DRQ09_02020 [candidate division KSB1 bacterium]|nr:MAG: hypothetical protein DRQ09_02020 [candidate division KSB1 bacterium]
MIKLVRIDDRLIHGQVLIGWGEYINPDRFVLCSNEIASNQWEKELYLSSAPSDIKISVFTVDETIENLKKGEFKKEKIILLVESPEILIELLDKGLEFNSVNIGGMHLKKNGLKILPYIYLDKKDINNFKLLSEKNIKLECQELPDSKKYDLMKLLKPYLSDSNKEVENAEV